MSGCGEFATRDYSSSAGGGLILSHDGSAGLGSMYSELVTRPGEAADYEACNITPEIRAFQIGVAEVEPD